MTKEELLKKLDSRWTELMQNHHKIEEESALIYQIIKKLETEENLSEVLLWRRLAMSGLTLSQIAMVLQSKFYDFLDGYAKDIKDNPKVYLAETN